jgi:hypothetical protein
LDGVHYRRAQGHLRGTPEITAGPILKVRLLGGGRQYFLHEFESAEMVSGKAKCRPARLCLQQTEELIGKLFASARIVRQPKAGLQFSLQVFENTIDGQDANRPFEGWALLTFRGRPECLPEVYDGLDGAIGPTLT